ncbi:unnamed protein product [Lampetra planeri]
MEAEVRARGDDDFRRRSSRGADNRACGVVVGGPLIFPPFLLLLAMAVATLSLLAVLGVTLRAALFRAPAFVEFAAERVEASTPVTAWKRVIEAMTMLDLGISPYSGDIFHETPMIIYVFHFLVDCSELVFMVSLLQSLALFCAVQQRWSTGWPHERQKHEHRLYKVDTSPLLLDPRDTSYLPLRVAMAYLLNPYTILTCVARSTCAINNLFIALSLLATLHGSILMMAVFLALATYQSLYPVMLIIPATLHMAQKHVKGEARWRSPAFWAFATECVFAFLGCLAILLCLSFTLLESWDFLGATYGFMLSVPDLTPNVGLFWYFFTEVFEHFRLFFICIFQINAFIYTVPLAVLLSKHPFFHMCLQVGLIAVFKSYPSVGDLALFLALLPMWTHLKCYLRNTLLVTCLLVVCSVLFPVLWHLWIFSGSANANFYYATTLAFNTGQILLISDYLYAFLRREFHLFHGLRVKSDDGKDSYVLLK